jgi:hypothetical protein
MDEGTAGAIEVLAQDVGEWDTELEISPGPGTEPIRTKGRTVNRIVGGRWLVSDHTTESGFEGHGVYGWDPTAARYVGIWVDTAGAGIARSEGDWDADARTMTLHAAVEHEGRTIRYREITERVDESTRVYRNVMPTPDGGEYVAIKATYHRR